MDRRQQTRNAFWEWFLGELGYEPKNEWDGGRSWINGPTYIVLVQADNPEHSFDRRASGVTNYSGVDGHDQ